MVEDINPLDDRSDVADFCSKRARELEVQIERMGIALEIDWENEVQVQAIAKEAVEHAREVMAEYAHNHGDYHLKAKVELFGLAALMMELMRESAGRGIHTHGGSAWKALSKALMKETGTADTTDNS